MTKPNDLPSGILNEMTIEEVRQFNAEVVVLGIGSTEPHGPHLPYCTDTAIVDGVGRAGVTAANQRGARALLYPTLPISNNVNFQAFPFACRVRVRTLMNMILDIIEALEADGIRKIVLLNGHGGNPDTLQAALREQVGRNRPGEGAFVCLTHTGGLAGETPRKLIEHGSAHAGEYETSMMMHLRPELVRTNKLDAFPIHQPAVEQLKTAGAYFVRPWHALMPASAGGETRTSSAEKGEQITQAAGQGLAALLVELSQTPWHELFPYAPGANQG